jgi:hypothetical protein
MSIKNEIYEDNLEKEAPLLSSIPKRNAFSVPDSYFDALPSQIMAKCRENEKRSSSVVYDKVFWLFKPQWMLAMFIGIAGICLILRKGGTTLESYETIAAAIPDSVFMAQIQNNIDYVDVSTLEDMAQKQYEMGRNVRVSSSAEDTANGKIINYLINNNIDASDVENEL